MLKRFDIRINHDMGECLYTVEAKGSKSAIETVEKEWHKDHKGYTGTTPKFTVQKTYTHAEKKSLGGLLLAFIGGVYLYKVYTNKKTTAKGKASLENYRSESGKYKNPSSRRKAQDADDVFQAEEARMSNRKKSKDVKDIFAEGGGIGMPQKISKNYELELDYKVGQTFEVDVLGGRQTCRILSMDFEVYENGGKALVDSKSYRIEYKNLSTLREESSHFSFLKHLQKEQNKIVLSVPFSIGGGIFYENSRYDGTLKLLHGVVQGFKVMYYGRNSGWYSYYVQANGKSQTVDRKDAYESPQNYIERVTSDIKNQIVKFTPPTAKRVSVSLEYKVGQEIKIPVMGGYNDAVITRIDVYLGDDYKSSPHSRIYFKDQTGKNYYSEQTGYSFQEFEKEIKALKTTDKIPVELHASKGEDVLVLHRYMEGSRLKIEKCTGYVLNLTEQGAEVIYMTNYDLSPEIYTSLGDFKNKISPQMPSQKKFAKGGNVRIIEDREERLGRPESTMESDVLSRVHYDKNLFVGNFGWRTPSGKLADGYFYALDDFDKNLVKSLRLKDGEKIYRYFNRTTAIGGMSPLIKINVDKGLLYFAQELENPDYDAIKFETRGTKAEWISLIKEKYAHGGYVTPTGKNIYWFDPFYAYEENGTITIYYSEGKSDQRVYEMIETASDYTNAKFKIDYMRKGLDCGHENIADRPTPIEMNGTFYSPCRQNLGKSKMLAMKKYDYMKKGASFGEKKYADGGSIEVGDVVKVKEDTKGDNFGYDGDYYVVADNVGYDRKSFLISDVMKREQGVWDNEQLEKLYADGGSLNEGIPQSIIDMFDESYVFLKAKYPQYENLPLIEDTEEFWDMVEDVREKFDTDTPTNYGEIGEELVRNYLYGYEKRFEETEYAKGGTLQENLTKELHKLQRDLNSSRLSTYFEGDTSENEMARQRERDSKIKRFNEVLETLNQLDTKYADGGRTPRAWGYPPKMTNKEIVDYLKDYNYAVVEPLDYLAGFMDKVFFISYGRKMGYLTDWQKTKEECMYHLENLQMGASEGGFKLQAKIIKLTPEAINDILLQTNYMYTTYKKGGTLGSAEYAQGGMIDLFEDYENIPTALQDVLDEYNEAFEDGDYSGLKEALTAVESMGYTFEYGLDGEAYGLRPKNTPLRQLQGYEDSEEFATGGGVSSGIKVGDWVTLKSDGKRYKVKRVLSNNMIEITAGAKTLIVNISDVETNVKFYRSKFVPVPTNTEVKFKIGDRVKFNTKKGITEVGKVLLYKYIPTQNTIIYTIATDSGWKASVLQENLSKEFTSFTIPADNTPSPAPKQPTQKAVVKSTPPLTTFTVPSIEVGDKIEIIGSPNLTGTVTKVLSSTSEAEVLLSDSTGMTIKKGKSVPFTFSRSKIKKV